MVRHGRRITETIRRWAQDASLGSPERQDRDYLCAQLCSPRSIQVGEGYQATVPATMTHQVLHLANLKVTSLPDFPLHIELLRISNLPVLASLPPDYRAQAIHLDSCPSLAHLGSWAAPLQTTSVRILACDSLSALHADHAHAVHVEHCRRLHTLRTAAQVFWLVLGHNALLTCLPTATVARGLCLSHLPVDDLSPLSFAPTAAVHLDRIPLATLPEDLRLMQLILTNLPSFCQLPRALQVDRSIIISDRVQAAAGTPVSILPAGVRAPTIVLDHLAGLRALEARAPGSGDLQIILPARAGRNGAAWRAQHDWSQPGPRLQPTHPISTAPVNEWFHPCAQPLPEVHLFPPGVPMPPEPSSTQKWRSLPAIRLPRPRADQDTGCVITLKPVAGLAHPTVVAGEGQRAHSSAAVYDLEALVRWLQVQGTNPLTRQKVERAHLFRVAWDAVS